MSARKSYVSWIVLLTGLIFLGGIAFWGSMPSAEDGKKTNLFLSVYQRLFSAAQNRELAQEEHHDDHPHASRLPALELSVQARKNLGLTGDSLAPLKLNSYFRSLSVPAIIVERPGQSRLHISTPLTGIVTEVLVQAGETVTPGTVLFRIRLTHEDLVQSQTQFLQSLGERDVERQEVERLQAISETGAVAGRVLLERQYALEKLNALINAQREALRLHGLSAEQIQQVESGRRLLQELDIVALSPQDHDHNNLHLSSLPAKTVFYQTKTDHEKTDHEPELVVLNLRVYKGQTVQAGEMLCELADYSQLLIEGKAFEKDAESILNASRSKWPLSAVLETANGPVQLSDLELFYVANSVDEQARVLPFYVRLPNLLDQDSTNSEGKRFIVWRYRVGQRLQLLVPVEFWENQFVLPVEAVVREGAEAYVFRENGKFFEQVPVHVKYRDQQNVVVENDGSLFPGDVIARKSAYQIQMAIKNQSGGPIDPHAGHSH